MSGDGYTSWDAVSWALKLEPVVKTRERFILVVLCQHVSERNGDVVWVGQRAIGRSTGQSPRTVERGLSELQRLGLIRRIANFRSDGSRTTDNTHINFDWTPPAKSTGPPVNVTGPPVNEDATDDRLTGHEPQGEPPQEPPEEPTHKLPSEERDGSPPVDLTGPIGAAISSRRMSKAVGR